LKIDKNAENKFSIGYKKWHIILYVYEWFKIIRCDERVYIVDVIPYPVWI